MQFSSFPSGPGQLDRGSICTLVHRKFITLTIIKDNEGLHMISGGFYFSSGIGEGKGVTDDAERPRPSLSTSTCGTTGK